MRRREGHFLGSALDGDVGLPELALGPVAHRVNYGDPRGGCCDDGFGGGEDTGPIVKHRECLKKSR